MKKIKVVQIGLAHDHSRCSASTIIKINDVFDFAAIVIPEDDPNTIFGSEPITYDGVKMLTLEEALNDPTIEAAVIETSELNLTKYAKLFADKGCAIQMDKPGGIVYSEFEELINTVRKKNLVFHTGYMYRYNPVVMKVMEMVKNGELGEITCVETHMDCLHNPEKRQWLGQFPGGMLFFLGCHLIDLIVQIKGFPKEILPLSTCSHTDGVTAEDMGFAVMKYDNGFAFAKTCANEKGGFLRRQLVVVGTKGTVELKPIEICKDGGQFTDYSITYNDGWYTPAESFTEGPYDRYEAMLRAFAEMVRGERVNPYTYDYELKLYRTILECCGAEIK